MVRVFLRSGSTVQTTSSPLWIIVAVVGLAAFLVFVLLLGAILTMVLAPFAIGLFLVGRWRLRRFIRQFDATRAAAGRTAGPAASDRIIDADYRVLDDGEDR